MSVSASVSYVLTDVTQSQDPQNSELLKVLLEGEQSVQSMLGIQSGGADALTALSLLCGGDYAIKGAENVGSKHAVRMLQHLLQGHQVVHKKLGAPAGSACPSLGQSMGCERRDFHFMAVSVEPIPAMYKRT